MIDLRSFLDGTPDVHDAHHSKVMRTASSPRTAAPRTR